MGQAYRWFSYDEYVTCYSIGFDGMLKHEKKYIGSFSIWCSIIASISRLLLLTSCISESGDLCFPTEIGIPGSRLSVWMVRPSWSALKSAFSLGQCFIIRSKREESIRHRKSRSITDTLGAQTGNTFFFLIRNTTWRPNMPQTRKVAWNVLSGTLALAWQESAL